MSPDLGLTDLVADLRKLRDAYAPRACRVTIEVDLGPDERLTVSLTVDELSIENSTGGSLVLPEVPS